MTTQASEVSVNRAELVAEQISKSFKSRQVVKGVSFRVRMGEVVGLLGPNGAGKTTSFYMVVGLLRPQSGRILMNDAEITDLPMHMRAHRGISYLPQNMSIFRRMTVADNLLAVMEVCGVPRAQRADRLEELLTKFQVSHIAKSMGAALSGGERRRVEIARALIIQPKFLLLDEPFAGIDPVTVHEIQQIILSLKNDGLGVLITDHNVRETLGSCDRAYILAGGQIIAHGLPDEVANNKAVRESYLGENFKF
jgi:lipopolysaccharide export system ATP-binding protein